MNTNWRFPTRSFLSYLSPNWYQSKGLLGNLVRRQPHLAEGSTGRYCWKDSGAAYGLRLWQTEEQPHTQSSK